MTKSIVALLDAALFIVASCIVFIPDLRVASMRYALYLLFIVSLVTVVRRLRATGMLSLTPKGIMSSPGRSQFSVLGGAAAIMAAVAVMVVGR